MIVVGVRASGRQGVRAPGWRPRKASRGDRQRPHSALLISDQHQRLRSGREVVIRAGALNRGARTPGVPPHCNRGFSMHLMQCVPGGRTDWTGRLGPFAMRRSGVRIPSAPLTDTGFDLRKRRSGPVCCLGGGVPPAYPCNACNWCNANETVTDAPTGHVLSCIRAHPTTRVASVAPVTAHRI